MNTTFQIVYSLLLWAAAQTGLSYKEVNVIVYYFVLPAVFLFLIDRAFKRFILSPIFVVAAALLVLTASDFSVFCDWLFDRSVVFLNSFFGVGWNYVEASVIFCVILPVMAILVLSIPAFRTRRIDTSLKGS